MDEKAERRLTKAERKIVEAIERKALKRKYKSEYTPGWIVDYMIESFKDFTYNEKEDATSMMEAIFTVAKKCETMTEKQIVEERKYMMKEYINSWFEGEDD